MENQDCYRPESWTHLYIGAKLIGAVPMSANVFRATHGRPTLAEDEEGYQVTYFQSPENYVSWSPKKVFELAYRHLTDAELAAYLATQ